MTLAIAGPVTVSGQHHTWLNPLLETGWFCCSRPRTPSATTTATALSTATEKRPFHACRRSSATTARCATSSTIRVTDVGFHEETLLEQDRFIRALPAPARVPAQDDRHRVPLPARRALRRAGEGRTASPEGLLALCARKAIPIFVGAPADGSVFLNSMKLWALRELGGRRLPLRARPPPRGLRELRLPPLGHAARTRPAPSAR